MEQYVSVCGRVPPKHHLPGARSLGREGLGAWAVEGVQVGAGWG